MCRLTHFNHVPLFGILWTIAWQAPLSMEFWRQVSWSGLPCPSLQGIFPTKGSNQVFFISCPGTQVLYHQHHLSSVQFSRSVVSDSLQPHEVQHARPPCPSPTPRVHSNSRPLSQWCHPAISSSVVPFSSCPQSLPASESFQWVNFLHEMGKVLEFQL